MEYIDVGKWGDAYRDVVEGQPIARYKNAAGEDWYEKVAHNINRPRGFAVGFDEAGVATFIADDLEQMNPGGLRVLVFPKFETGVELRRAILGRRFNFDTREFDPAPAPPSDFPYPTPFDAIRDILKRLEALEARDGGV